MSDDGFKLPPQQPRERPEAKPQHKELKGSRRIYEVKDLNVTVFWLNSDNSRTPIPTWWEPRPLDDLIQYLRSKGYCTLEEAADRS